MMSVLRKNPWLGEIEGRDVGVGRGSSLINKEGLETCVICCIVYYSSYCCRISCYCSNYHIFDIWLLSYLVLETNKTFFLIMMMVVPVSPFVSLSRCFSFGFLSHCFVAVEQGCKWEEHWNNW